VKKRERVGERERESVENSVAATTHARVKLRGEKLYIN